ncbi:hypothetical protein [Paracoccus mutanolyticus]|uniref:hypothetical protein n=1 Tax=Paracoccus mutanolyticus TaxID=1499308 RepID=UPI001674645A|nr:hypothetical protein [Paracoccus mutanolyticus]
MAPAWLGQPWAQGAQQAGRTDRATGRDPAALIAPQHEVNTHFSTPPYSIIAMKDSRVHRICAAPTGMTPGRVQPGNGTGRLRAGGDQQMRSMGDVALSIALT